MLLLSPRGHRYRFQLQLRWVDAQDVTKQGEHVFEAERTADFPEIVPWEKLVHGAQLVRVLFDDTFSFVGQHLQAMHPTVSYSALIVSSVGGLDTEETARLSNVQFVPEGTSARLFDLVGQDYGKPRHYILIDEHTALLQDRESLKLGEIVRDPERVSELVATFGQLWKPEREKRKPDSRDDALSPG